LNGDDIVIRRTIEGGFEKLRGRLPLLITVTNSAEKPRPPSAKRMMFWKKGTTGSGIEDQEARERLGKKGLLIPLWNLEELGCPANICGFQGSATWIKSVESVKLTPRESKSFDASDQGVKDLLNELVDEHII
jgi:electron transfer flavoprotein beta subunit